MKIEKKKLSANSNWNAATKAGLAALMGLSAAAMTACDDDNSVAAPINNTNPSSGNVQEPELESPDAGSSSSQVVVDIPKSSSSVDMELLSSSSWQGSLVEPILEAGVIPPIEYPEITPVEVSSSSEQSSSSSESRNSVEESLSSSSLEIEPMAGDPVPLPEDYEWESSSSSKNVESSSSDIVIDVSTPNVQETPYDSHIHLCPDDGSECFIASMVTTFERTDIDV